MPADSGKLESQMELHRLEEYGDFLNTCEVNMKELLEVAQRSVRQRTNDAGFRRNIVDFLQMISR